MNSEDISQAVNVLKSGGVAVLPTDTIYGLHGLALNPQVEQKISQLKGREENKSYIILISSLEDLQLFDIQPLPSEQTILEKIWPDAVSVIINHRAFRMPASQIISEILRQTGPLISTSANLSGDPPAKNIEEAKKYFGNEVDYYLDDGKLDNSPSTLIKLADGKVEILRQGSVVISI